ncbi:C1 family peptidase [Ferruginibacter profundus]
MKKVFLFAVSTAMFMVGVAQNDVQNAAPQAVKPKETNTKDNPRNPANYFTVEKSIAATSVKNQAMTGTCWCFSTTSLVESQCLKNSWGEYDLSEMFSVRNIYIEKAKNYILRQGHAQFGEGGLGHDLIRAIATYGAVPESVYSGLKAGQTQHNHVKLSADLKKYVDSVMAIHPLPENWLAGYTHILDTTLGTPPEKFTYNGKSYTPQTFAEEALHFNANDYVNITSFTHHGYYQPFILEVPDNFSNGAYYNVPLADMIQLTKDALNKGYSVLWDADVSNDGFQQRLGAAVNLGAASDVMVSKMNVLTGDVKEAKSDAATRQALFENLTTQDDHLMHITGIEKARNGNSYFLVKNSWGDVGPAHGYINVSESYFAINTISLVVPKAALSKALLEKLKLK